MACMSEFSSNNDDLKSVFSDLDLERSESQNAQKKSGSFQFMQEDKVIKLKRGGVVVSTKIGNIQFGIPPETIKDSLKQKIEVPKYFVIPHQRFDKKYGVNIAEFEFPAYFNFFLKQRKVFLIGSKEAERAVKIVFQETLIGPKDHSRLKEDFTPSYKEDCIPDFHQENVIFNPKGSLSIDHLIKFLVIDDDCNTLELEDNGHKVQLKLQDGVYDIIENGVLIERVKDLVQLDQQQIKEMIQDFEFNKHSVDGVVPNINLLYSIDNIDESPAQKHSSLKQSWGREDMNFKHQGDDFKITVWGNNGFNSYMDDFQSIRKLSTGESFDPPDFGVTILGASHGFDPNGSTSGLILWINGNGIMVDPPPFAMNYLKDRGISSILIKGIIITHCHADHDAGTFHKVLDHNKIEIITTKTIMRSFMKKYSALSRIPEENLETLFYYRPATIGASLNIYGAEFNFFYSLHTIPCIGFEVSMGSKSLFFSGDTYYDKAELKKALEANKIKKGRYDEMVNRDFQKYDIIIHEAGIPPIHTPQSTFRDMEPAIKNKLFLYHIATKDIDTKSGLKGIKHGIENTLVLISKTQTPQSEAIKLLDFLSSIQLFESMNVRSLKWMIDSLKSKDYLPNELIVQEGEIGDSFFIVASGIVKIFSQTKGQEFQKIVQSGSYFGETALINHNQKRQASVMAVTNVKVYYLLKHDFEFIFGVGGDNKKGSVINKFKSLASARNSKILSVINKNTVLAELQQSQKTQMEIILKEQMYVKGENIWQVGEKIKKVVIIKSGLFEFYEEGKEVKELVSGMYVGETDKLIFNSDGKDQETHLTTLRCVSQKGAALLMSKKDIQSFLKNNPGLKLIFTDSFYFGAE